MFIFSYSSFFSALDIQKRKMSEMEKQLTQESKIGSWYAGKTLFVTGATGFMGKVLIEKLLRDCPDIKEINLLMRAKRGQEPEQRREDYINHMVNNQNN